MPSDKIKYEIMKLITKRAIADAFRKLLEQRSIEKITVKDIVNECGLNRQTFYYHFYDIYDLMEWMINEARYDYEKRHPVEAGQRQERMMRLFEFFRSRRKLILNGYDHAKRVNYETMVMNVIYPAVDEMLRQCPVSAEVPEEKIGFLCKAISWVLLGIVFEWVEDGMLDTDMEELRDYFRLIDNSFESSLELFAVH